MTFVDKIILTEEEALKLSIEHGLSGSERRHQSFLKNNVLRGNDQVNALLKDLATLAEHVEVIGKGKKRQYILEGFKDSPSKRVDGRESNGAEPTPYDLLMDEYIFNRLLTLYKKNRLESRPISFWQSKVGLFDVRIEKDNVIDSLNELHKMTHGYIPTKDAEDVFFNLKRELHTRNRNVLINAFNHLSKSDRIEVIYTDVAKHINGGYEILKPDKLQAIEETREAVLSVHDLSYGEYCQMLWGIRQQNDNFEEAQKALDNAYRHRHEIEYPYKSIEIKILDETIRQEVTKTEMIEAFKSRLLELFKDRKDKNTFIKKYRYLHTLHILKDLMTIPYEDYEVELEKLCKEQAQFKTEHKKRFGDITDFF